VEADPKSQAAYEMVSKNALRSLTSDEAANMLAEDSKARGADVAIADAVQTVLEAISKAGEGSGYKMPPDVLEASQRMVAKVLVGMMVGAGLKRDPEEVMAGVEKRLGIEPAEDSPDDEAEDRLEDGEEEMA
jgi:hypothetical protein